MNILHTFKEMETKDILDILVDWQTSVQNNFQLNKRQLKDMATRIFNFDSAVSHPRDLHWLTEKQRALLYELGKIRSSLREVDRPVSFDLHRLIRVPGSLHGGTGLRVTEIDSLDDLKAFDPLSDAIAFSMDNEIEINVLKPIDIKFGGERIKLDIGMRHVGEAFGIFLSARSSSVLSRLLSRTVKVTVKDCQSRCQEGVS